MIGFSIAQRPRRIAPEMVAAFAELPVSVVSDSMQRMSAAGAALRPLHAGGVLAGAALTVRVRPGDNLMLHKALDMAEPGDVIVVDGGGALDNALMGEMMIAHAAKRGVVGVVIDGAVRDLDAIRQGRFPVYAAGVTHRGPYKDGPGEINAPVSLRGMVVNPGDLVLGDADGVLSVPIDAAEEVLKAAQAKLAAEERQMAAIAAGTSDRSWIDATLRAKGLQP